MLDREIISQGDKYVPGSPKLEVDKFFHSEVMEPQKPGYYEPVLFNGIGKSDVYLVFPDLRKSPDFPNICPIMVKVSQDAGRSWDKPWYAKDKKGAGINDCVHISWLRLKSGRLGMVYSSEDKENAHPGRDCVRMVFFRTSEDEGRTWSDPVPVGKTFSLCCAGHAVVLSGGRILAPVFKWISPFPGPEAEAWVLPSNEPSPSFSYSFTYVSDDEGKTWKRSLSELYISVNRAAYDLEEPTVVELRDGRILMHLRSEQGRMYRSYSRDGGISWSRPEGLQIAASNTPSILKRMPTGNLLMIWNQASRQEITTLLCRHRLSCAISKDDGKTWENFKNLESLDDVTVVTPPPDWETHAYQPYDVSYGHCQPQPGHKRYHRAPGVLRICYPNVIFAGNEALIVYDYGWGVLGDRAGFKFRAIPVDWFEKKESDAVGERNYERVKNIKGSGSL